MELLGTNREELVDYISRQLDHFFPDRRDDVHSVINQDLDDALSRFELCSCAVKLWKPKTYNYLHSEQSTMFLYILSNTIYKNRGEVRVPTKLFGLNKALNGFSCFFDTELPDIWFVGHSPGIVLARATYGNYFAVYQNSTVGKNHGVAPVLEEKVVMFPNSAIVGHCRIRPATIVGQGQRVVDQETPGNCCVFNDGPRLICKRSRHDVLSEIFRL